MRAVRFVFLDQLTTNRLEIGEGALPSVFEITEKRDAGSVDGSPLLVNQEQVQQSLGGVLALTITCARK